MYVCVCVCVCVCVSQASLIKQSFTALTINEMKGLTFDPDSEGRGMKDGDQVCVCVYVCVCVSVCVCVYV